jgi:hypothetical protein
MRDEKEKSCSRNIRQGKRTTNSKLEIRNTKQIQMIEKHKIPNQLPSDSVFWIFPIGDLFAFSLFRIWIFGFRILLRPCLGKRNTPR